MKKRFTDCDKWSKAWFRKLPKKYKLFWYFILDKCDPVGVWDIDFEAASFFIGDEINQEVFDLLSKHILRIDDDKVWIKDFVYFQYGVLEEGKGGKPHQSYIRDLKRHNLWKTYVISLKDYPNPLVTLTEINETLKDKEKEQDKDQEQDKEKDIDKDKDQEQEKETSVKEEIINPLPEETSFKDQYLKYLVDDKDNEIKEDGDVFYEEQFGDEKEMIDDKEVLEEFKDEKGNIDEPDEEIQDPFFDEDEFEREDDF